MQTERQNRPPADPLAAAMGPALKMGAACGGGAFLFGSAAGIIRGVSPVLFGTASAIQTFALSSMFTGTRIGIIRAWTPDGQTISPRDLTKASAAAGCVSGGVVGSVMGYLARGRANPIPGAIMFTLFGAFGQHAYNKWTSSEMAPAKSEQGFWKRMSEKSWSPVKIMTNQEYAEVLIEKMIKYDVEISMIDDKIAALREAQKCQSNGSSPEK